MKLLIKKILFILFFGGWCALVNAETFVVKHIQINGLQRISLGTALSYLSDTVKEGDKIDTSETSEIIHALYRTNFFSDVRLERSHNDLIIHVVERAIIGSLHVIGNNKITKKQLMEALKNVGIATGQSLDHAILNAMQQAIIQQYYNMGMYAAKVNIDVKSEVRNRASVTINIHEGPKAKIRSIKIVGNKAFSQRKLLGEFSLTTSKPWSFFTNSDQYSKEKLDADLEKLRSYYMDYGYLHIKVDSTKVSITPDKKNLYIVIYITEGDIYKVNGFSLETDLSEKKSEIAKLIDLKPGDIYSRKHIAEIQENISFLLSEYGYGMPEIQAMPENIDEKHKKIWVKFLVHPGHRMYIRHISFSGNYKTNDEVLRREMRLQEGSAFSLSKINESERRLLNLGYIQDVEYKVSPVPESNNQVDLNYALKETSAISANFQAGYSDRDSFLYGASLSDANIFGTGKTVSIGFDNSKSTQFYKIGYRDPYLTTNKLGFSLDAYLRKTNSAKRSDVSAYSTDIYGASATFDYPLSDYTTVLFGFGAEHLKIQAPNAETRNDDVGIFFKNNGNIFNQFKFIAGLDYSNIDRAIFPTKGFGNSLRGELYVPMDRSSLQYYTLDYTTTWYQPLFSGFIFHTYTDIGYGDSIGKNKKLPFFKNFYAGGIGSVRGFESGTLGDNVDYSGYNSLGGNILTVASGNIIIPSPWKDTIRPSVFVDVGNVYSNYFKIRDLRSSCGIQLEWRTPLRVPVIFSLAKTLRRPGHNHINGFQFSISASI